MQAHGSGGASQPTGRGSDAAAAGPSKGGVDDAVASLLGLADASSSEDLSSEGPWSNWEASGSGPQDAVLRRRLTASDVQRSRLSLPAPLFSLLFGVLPYSASAPLEVAIQTAGSSSSNVHTLTAEPARGGAAVVMAGQPVGQVFAQLGAGLADVISLRRQGSTQQGDPLVVCSLAEPAEPAVRHAAAAAAAKVASAASGSPTSSGAPLPAGRGGSQPHREQQQQSGSAMAAAAQGEEEPAAPGTAQMAAAVPGRPSLDAQTPEAAAASLLAAVAEEDARPGASAGASAPDEGASADPDWQATKPKGRGRPRKRRPASAGGGRQGDAAPVQCGHCGTGETPRWWNLPTGTLCNACGIWLKRHGYPRPVQFFISPAAAAATTAPRVAQPQAQQQAQQQQQQQQQQQPGAGAGPAGREPPPDVEYYLINGRPKRRRTAASSSSGGGAAAAAGAGPPAPLPAAAPAPAPLASGASGEAAAPAAGAAAAAAAAAGAASVLAGADLPINFEAAGSRVFVVRRKLIKAEGGDAPTAALVHFGWAPAARCAHQMFGAVARFAEASSQVSVDDFELLSDCRATATLQLRPGAA
ncbi:hypothetical protein ABPG77_006869, partial [Micractinium sp. CCAP 211/92]